MFPIRDENENVRTPVATMAIIGINIFAWVFVQGLGSAEPLARSLCEYALIPGELFGHAPIGAIIPVGQNMGCQLEQGSLLSLITHQFLHGGWFHIIANMWFLWVFGDNVEDVMGPGRFVVFYLMCGLAAAFAQIMTDPAALTPMVGASGAIGGVLGAYARLYPYARIVTFIFLGIFFTTVSLPAIGMLGYWFFLQIAGGLPALQSTGGGVAFWAHIGGFLAGLVLAGVMPRPDYLAQHRARNQF